MRGKLGEPAFYAWIPAGIDNVQRALGDGAHLSEWS